jgi:hypothetical protein
MLRRCGSLGLVVAALAAFATACGGSGDAASSSTASTPAPMVTYSPPPPCPTSSHPVRTNWPSRVPEDLPKPANATIQSQTTASDGVHIVKFTTPTSLRDSVLFVVHKLPKAGYVLGRGDAEATEADAPFVHGNLRGLVRMLGVAPCQTLWLLASVDASSTSNSPLLTPHSPTSSPSPLPFG